MRKVARVLVRHLQLHVALRLRQADLGEPFAEVLHASFQVGVEVLQMRAAAGGVDHERVELA